jgi:polysaccharide biosynthesis transport protein
MASSPLSANSAAAAPYAVEQRRGFDLRQFWHSFLERIWIVILCVIAGLFLALGYLARTPKLYQGHTVLEVDFQEPTILNDSETSSRAARSTFLASLDALRTIEQNLRNRSLLARVVRAEDLARDGGRALLGTSVTAPKENRPAPAGATEGKGIEPQFTSALTLTPLEEGLGGALSTMVAPVIRRGTRLIDLYVTNRDPAMAQRLAEAVGREYIRSSIEQRASFSQDTLRYLLEEEARLKKNLQKSEAAVAEYKAKTPDAVQLGGSATATGSQTGAGSTVTRGGVVEDKLQELSSKLQAVRADRIKLEAELAQVADAGQNVEALLAIQTIANAQPVMDRRHDVAQGEATVAALSQRYKQKHPKMIQAQAALQQEQDALGLAVLAQPALMKNGLEQMRATETSLEAASRDQEKAAIALNRAAIPYQELARQAETDRALYESVLKQIKETNLTKDVKATAVTVIEHSPLPGVPVSPKPLKAIVLGLLAGVAAGIAFVYAADALDRSVKTVDQAEAATGLPVLAAIPETKRDGAKRPGKNRKPAPLRAANYRLVADAPDSPIAEAFRNLRAALSLLGPQADRRIFLFTSALPSEGKSFASANCAIALAQQGQRVLLIDGDLRRPTLHRIFSLPPAQSENGELPGLIDCLVGESSLDRAVRQVFGPEIAAVTVSSGPAGNLSAAGGQLDILAGGRRAPNPAEILSGPRFAEVLEEAVHSYDLVVVDSAPVLAVSDTLLMTQFVQTVCMVLQAGKTPRHVVHRAITLLTTASGRPAGLVLNRLPSRRGAGGYYYHYASPGYGEGSYAGYYGHYGEKPAAAVQKSNGA